MGILLPYQAKWIEDRGSLKVWLASRQVGKSFTLALEAIGESIRDGADGIILSASERQSKEVMNKALLHIKAMEGVGGKKIMEGGGVEEVKLVNGKKIISLPANPATVRGFAGNVYLDEFAFHRDCEEIWRAIYPAVTRGFKVRVASTPNGKNLFYDLWNSPEFSKHETTVYRAKEDGLQVDTDAIKRNMSEDAFNREYMCSFEASAVGSYYGELLKQAEIENRVSNIPYDSSVPVHTFWDLGLGVGTAIWFVQMVGKEVRFIDYYQPDALSHEGLPDFIRHLRSLPYVYATHHAPHDIKVKEYGSNKTRYEIAQSLGIDFRLVENIGVADGIEAVKCLLPRSWFDKTKCKKGLDAIKNYCREWDEVREMFKEKPYKNWTGHGADALRYVAVGESHAIITPRHRTVTEVMARTKHLIPIWG